MPSMESKAVRKEKGSKEVAWDCIQLISEQIVPEMQTSKLF